MLVLLKIITKNLKFSLKRSFSSPKLFSDMNEVKIKKPHYDGRNKKRKWEERRSDKGEGLESKHIKTDNKTVEVPVEKIIDKIKRRKFVLLMGYSGVNYLGMQRNPGRKTIEEELFKALKNLGFLNTDDFSQIQNVSFQRAARTDKGL